MSPLLIATHNQAKLKELLAFSKQFAAKGYSLTSLDNLSISAEPDETGSTFKENALLKAQFYAKLASIPTIADDGGLTIDYLHGAPGVLSRRWPGYDASDKELVQLTLQKLQGVPKEKRPAKLQICLCYFNPQTKKKLFSETYISGYIAEKPSAKATPGYPYRSLFILAETNTYYDELTHEQHQTYNHRVHAMRKLIDLIQ